MARKNGFIRRTIVATVMVGAVGLAQPASAAGIPVIDITAILQLIAEQITSNDQLLQEIQQTSQMLTDYSLQLQNLQQLPGTLRADIQNRLATQLTSNLGDFGASLLESITTSDPNPATFYTAVETTLKAALGETPRAISALNIDLTALGITPAPGVPMYDAQIKDRVQYERILDGYRNAALVRKNAADRATQAVGIANQMAGLPDNNTVGAIQLLGAQQSLGYAQNEELLKMQALLLKTMQESKAQQLAESELFRQAQITRLKGAQADNYNGYVSVPSY